MTRARGLAAAVSPRVWAAFAGLVLLASLGVTLVLTAGLATFRGGVTHHPVPSGARPPASVLTPPGSAVVVVPTPVTHRPAPVAPHRPATLTGATGPVTVPARPVVAPAPAPTTAPPPAVTPPTAHPRTTEPGTGSCTLPGKRLGWFKHGSGKALAAGRPAGHGRHGC